MTEQKDDIIDFTAIINRVKYPFVLLKKHYKLSLVYVFVAVTLSLVLKLTLPPVYSGSFIIKSNEDKDLYFLNMLMDLQSLVKDNDHTGTARELNVPEIAAILSFNAITIFYFLACLRLKICSSKRISFMLVCREPFNVSTLGRPKLGPNCSNRPACANKPFWTASGSWSNSPLKAS